jgi:hypothetical protein
MEHSRQHNRLILSGQVILNLFLAWMLLSTFNIVFLLPFPYNVRVPDFLTVAALGLAAASISGSLYLYRRRERLAIVGILKTPPVLVWCFVSLGLAVVLGLCVRAYPNQWSTY